MTSPLAGSPPPGLSEGFVQLPPDSTGKQLRAFPVTVYQQQADGTFAAATAYQQVLILADADGNLIGVQGSPLVVATGLERRLDEICEVLQEMLAELKRNS